MHSGEKMGKTCEGLAIAEYLIPVKPGFGGFDEPYDRASVVFVGVPLDVTSSYRSGMRFAPASIREASANLETYLLSAGVDVFERLGISDLGDLRIAPTDILETGRRIEAVVRKINYDGKLPALLWGEHTITYFALQPFPDAFLIQLDAHRDLREEYMGDRVCHATVMRRVLDKMPAYRLLQVGVRSCSKEEDEFARECGIQTYTAEEVMENPTVIASKIRERVGNSPAYLTIDIDVLDPAFAPGVSTPEPGGLTTVDALRIVRELGRLNLCAFDVTELAPPYDNGAAAFAAGKIIYEVLASFAKRD